MGSPEIRLEDVSLVYEADGSTVLALEGLDCRLAAGQVTAIIGPSGCGKSTMMQITRGFMAPSRGRLSFHAPDGTPLDRPPRMATVWQSFNLFPWRTVEENVAFGLEMSGMPAAQRREKAHEALRSVDLAGFERKYPRQLSGGMRQRVGMARALVMDPDVLLLDEPFGALDKNLRLDMQIEVKRLQRELSITTVMVTHDQEEALSMADRIAVMSHGVIEQLGTPEAIYDRPQTRFVAEFVGHTNLFSGRLERGDARFEVALDVGGTLALQEAAPCSRNGAVRVSVRPEHLEFAPHDPSAIPATVELVLPLGPAVVYELALARGEKAKVTLARTGGAVPHRPGEATRLRVTAGAPVAVFQA
jgi:putative spermidine/putrescine transport system ATP-binding protein